MSDSERKAAERIQSAIDEGGFPVKSYLANQFRQELKQNTEEADKCHALTSLASGLRLDADAAFANALTKCT